MRSVTLPLLSRLLAVGALVSLVEPAQAQGRAAKLAWMSGCWERRTPTMTVREQWMIPGGGMLLGESRTMRGDKVVEFETLRIVEAGDTLVYHATPSGQEAAQFRALTASDTLVVFENLAHDFPQRIIYRRQADSLKARIEGVRDGKVRGIDYPYARASCERAGK